MPYIRRDLEEKILSLSEAFLSLAQDRWGKLLFCVS